MVSRELVGGQKATNSLQATFPGPGDTPATAPSFKKANLFSFYSRLEIQEDRDPCKWGLGHVPQSRRVPSNNSVERLGPKRGTASCEIAI